MATLGNSTTPTFGFDQFTSTANQAAQWYTVPSAIVISSVSFYGSGNGASSNTAYGCIWSNTGVLLAQGSGVSTSGGSGSGGGQAWHTDTLTSPLYVAAGTQIYIGWQRSTATTFDWSFANDNATNVGYHTAGNTPSNFGAGASVQNGSIGAYATYSPAGVWIEPAGVVKAPVAVWCNPGSGPAHVVAIYVSNGAGGVKRIW